MKIFEMIIDDGRNVFKVIRPAENQKQLKARYENNGEIVRIKDVTYDYPISLEKVRKALDTYLFGKAEQDIIVALVQSLDSVC